MNKAEIVAAIADQVNLTKREAETAYDTMVDAVVNALIEEDKVILSGLGIFEVKEKAARAGRNPKTGEEILIPAKKAVVFKPAKTLKEKFEDEEE